MSEESDLDKRKTTHESLIDLNYAIDHRNLVKSVLQTDRRYKDGMLGDLKQSQMVTIDNNTLEPPTHRVTLMMDDRSQRGRKIVKKGKFKKEARLRMTK